LIVAAAGNVQHGDFISQVYDAFWRMMGRSKPAGMTQPEYRSGVRLQPAPVSQSYFSLGVRLYPYAHPDRYALHILNSVLGGGISSRLFRRLREQHGNVYDIHSEYHAYQDDGILVIEGSTSSDHLMEVLRLTLDELQGLLTGEDPVEAEELWKAKMQLRGQYLISSENADTRMKRLATQELYFGRYIPHLEILEQIENVETETLQTIARNICKDAGGRRTVAVVGAEAPEYYCASKIEHMTSGYQ
jgi:predicted Zn-dependent peptidase